MRIGYACLTVGIPGTNYRSCIMKNATPEKLHELIGHNLGILKAMLEFNARSNVRFFRISSDIIPFGSSPVNKLDWPKIFSAEFKELAQFIKENDIRVTMHPGQYTVLNSQDKGVVSRAVDDLIYHTKFLDALETPPSSKIILHIGGVYGDKESALKRFADSYKALDSGIKQRLIIENDDKSYNIGDVLSTGHDLGIPVVYDNLHSEVNPFGNASHAHWIQKAKETWSANDGRQKIHYSQQAQGKNPGSHSATIAVKDFIEFTESLDSKPDIMLEVKDKNISAVKCVNALNNDKSACISDWQRYKYKVLELSPNLFNSAQKMLEGKNFNAVDFYSEIEQSFNSSPIAANQINAAKAVFSAFGSIASEKDKDKFNKGLYSFEKGLLTLNKMKSLIYKAAVKYADTSITNSYYFHLKD